MATPETPAEAGVPGRAGPTRAYENADIRVLWDSTRCIHVGHCLRALPTVFDTRRRPWVDLTGGDPADVARAVETCPTGALRYESTGGSVPDEVAAETTTIELQPNGPLYVRGRVRVTEPRGHVIAEETRLALCRCGESRNRPFCDNTHRDVGFVG
ncbi:MAG TPA: (4Fe-4S)-binding protein [Acidimicrobiales bacterium]